MRAHAAVYQCADQVVTSDPSGHRDCVEIKAEKVEAPKVQSESYYGLGVSQDAWNKKFGAPKDCFSALGTTVQCQYENPSKIINITDSRINLIQFSWPNRKNLLQSREAAKKYIPKDSEIQQSFVSKNSGSTVDLFRSSWLKNQFEESSVAWYGGNPGEFIVIHAAWGVTIAAGNNP